MKVAYSSSDTWQSHLVRTTTWSDWSHCGIITPNGTVIEAISTHGVREIPYEQFVSNKTQTVVKEIVLPSDDNAIAFARKQIGKPYDLKGVIGIGVHRDWQEDDCWFCSELIEAACVAGGRQRFVNDANRVTPQESWMVV